MKKAAFVLFFVLFQISSGFCVEENFLLCADKRMEFSSACKWFNFYTKEKDKALEIFNRFELVYGEIESFQVDNDTIYHFDFLVHEKRLNTVLNDIVKIID